MQLIYPSGRKLIYAHDSAGHFRQLNFASYNGVSRNVLYYRVQAREIGVIGLRELCTRAFLAMVCSKQWELTPASK